MWEEHNPTVCNVKQNTIKKKQQTHLLEMSEHTYIYLYRIFACFIYTVLSKKLQAIMYKDSRLRGT